MDMHLGLHAPVLGVASALFLTACPSPTPSPTPTPSPPPAPAPICTTFTPGNAAVAANGGAMINQTICTHGTLDVSANGQSSATINGHAERVRVLVIDGRSNVDLRGLENTDVEFLGTVNGNIGNIGNVGSSVQLISTGEVRFDSEVDGLSHVRVKSGNNVIFHRKIDGGSIVCIDAPGTVTGPEVNGRSQVIVARQPQSFSFPRVDGGSVVKVGDCPF